MPVVVGAPVRRKLRKAELREQADAALLAWREGQTAKSQIAHAARAKRLIQLGSVYTQVCSG